MKKQLLSIFIAASAWYVANAQITITQSDLPIINSVFISRTDTLFTSGPGSSGANQTWNYGSLIHQLQDTVGFTSPASTPGASAFPMANLCVADPANNAYIYFLKSASELSFLGYYLDLGFGPQAYPITPSQKIITLPATFNTNFSNSSLLLVEGPYPVAPADSIRLRRRIVQNSTIDAWGSLTTPSGTFNTIRQNLYEITYDSVFVRIFGNWTFASVEIDTSRYFRWWANGRGYYDLEIVQSGSNANTIRSSYLHQTTMNVSEIQPEELFVFTYPNPAVNEINFMTNNKSGYTLQIFDVNGRFIESKVINTDLIRFDLSNYHSGNYFYTLLSPQGENILSGKFIVSK